MRDSLRFPENFLWGAATAAHQIEGGNRNTDWWRSEERRQLPHRSGDACDSWNLHREDTRLLRELGLNAYRLSVEWARVEPVPGIFNDAALAHYRAILEDLRLNRIEPVVTLHHFTNPLRLADRGAWTATEMPQRFAAYAERVARYLGDLVHWWVTINEPNVFGNFGYLTGVWPPRRERDFSGYLRHLRGCARGHALARQALRSVDP